MNDKPKKAKKTAVFRYVYIALTIIVIILIGALDPNFKGMLGSLSKLDLSWLLGALLMLFAFWATDALLLWDITSYMSRDRLRPLSALKTGLVGLYYGALTPSSTGGQPMQVVYLRRDGIPAGTGTGVVSVKFVMYELSLCASYVVAVILHGSSFISTTNEMFWVTLVGFVINLTVLTFIILTMVSKRFVDKCARGIIKFCGKIRVIKDCEKALAGFQKTIGEFNEAMHQIVAHKWRCFVSFLISVLNLVALFSVTYCVYRAMGFTVASYLDLATMSLFLSIAVSLIPTPGAAGASEGGFYLFFGSYFPSGMLFMGMLLWRFLTYYMILFVGSLVVVLDEFLMVRRRKKLTGKTED